MTTALLTDTLSELRALRCAPMADELERILNEPDHVHQSFLGLVARLVDRQLNTHAQNRSERLRKQAHLRQDVSLQAVKAHLTGSFSKKIWATLASMSWFTNGHNLIFIGPSWSGKTWVSSALAREVLNNGKKGNVLHTPTHDLLNKVIALGERDREREIKRLGRLKLLVLDNFAVYPMDLDAISVLNDIIAQRWLGGRSTIVCSPTPIEAWGSLVEHPTLLGQLRARLFERHQVIELPSRLTANTSA